MLYWLISFKMVPAEHNEASDWTKNRIKTTEVKFSDLSLLILFREYDIGSRTFELSIAYKVLC